MSRTSALLLASLTLASVAGCRASSESYEGCFDSTDCISPGDGCFTVQNGSRAADICTTSCLSDADCPFDDFGSRGTCYPVSSGNICLQSCSSDFDCYGSLRCTTDGVCLPNPGSTGGFVSNYRSCVASSDCRDPSLECVTFDVGGRREAVCTRTGCFNDDDCPVDIRGGRGACLDLGAGPTACWERCNFRADCPDTVDWDCAPSVGGIPVPPPGVCAPR